MEENERLERAREMRRSVLGDAYVDAQSEGPNPGGQELQDFITETAWGVWARGGPLSTRDRSLLVLAMTAALGRMDEFELHARARTQTGVTEEELDELLFQLAAYAGAPAAVSARRVLRRVASERDEE